MTKTIEASQVNIKKCGVLFDTNVWLMLEGFDLQAPRDKVAAYGDAYKALIKGGNQIVVNNYVLSEFCHRAGILMFEDMKDRNQSLERFSFKTFRRKREFRPMLQEIRQRCLQILDNCDFIAVAPSHYDLDDTLDIFATGTLDFTDIIIAKFCIKENYFLMSDDKDFTRHDFNLTLITHFNK